MMQLPPWLHSLNYPNFAKLYLAQAINLVGDALTWLGLALLAFELAGDRAGTVLAIALTLRVTAFVLLSPLAGVLGDRIDRKSLMITTHLCRMVIVSLLPWVTQVEQLYAIVLGLNIFAAFFTPIYTATIPLVTTAAERPNAIALSSATYQLLGVLGPGFAGGMAALVGTRQIFWMDGLTFLLAAILIAIVPGKLIVPQTQVSPTIDHMLADIRVGSQCLWADQPIRYGLLLQLVIAIVGAAILVNTIGYVQGVLHLDKLAYGWVMAAFGLGATLTAVGWGHWQHQFAGIGWMTIGATLITIAILPANAVGLVGLMLLWLLAGVGQTLVNVPMQNLIADRVVVELQGRVYGAQFAWSHLWWAFAYPLAGWFGQQFQANFLYSSLLGLGLLAAIVILAQPLYEQGQWHEHEHQHDTAHQHQHLSTLGDNIAHRHLHFHTAMHD